MNKYLFDYIVRKPILAWVDSRSCELSTMTTNMFSINLINRQVVVSM